MYKTHISNTVNTEMCGNADGISHRTAGERLVDMGDCNGWTPLHYACYDSNKELVEQLLKAGADTWARYFCCKFIVCFYKYQSLAVKFNMDTRYKGCKQHFKY